MAQQKPSIPKGMRDFSATEVARRNYIFSVLASIFRLYGFTPIETAAMENLTTLSGKYGQEGDRLLFKVLNSGDYGRELTPDQLRNSVNICDKGLRYDLTVPFARYVVQHRNELTFPFKRYQIAPVWRADRPQKGRYREFVQCDIDVIGTKSLICEAELCQIVEQVFKKLKLRVTLKINNRKILMAIAQWIGHGDKLIDMATAIDKFDKIGLDGVHKELQERGVSSAAIDKLQPILDLTGTNNQKLDKIEQIVGPGDGIDQTREILRLTKAMGVELPIELDLSLARGLSYYTGAIFEVKALDAAIGSICGGGRYDDLTGIFGLNDTSGVGISFGAERIFDVMNELNLFPDEIDRSTKVLFANLSDQEVPAALAAAQMLRNEGIATEVYPSPEKLKKQFDYADTHKIPYIAFVGQKECETNSVTIKNLATGQQTTVPVKDLHLDLC